MLERSVQPQSACFCPRAGLKHRRWGFCCGQNDFADFLRVGNLLGMLLSNVMAPWIVTTSAHIPTLVGLGRIPFICRLCLSRSKKIVAKLRLQLHDKPLLISAAGLHSSLNSFPPSADCPRGPGVHHLFPSNSGDTEQHPPDAALRQCGVVQLGAVFTGNQTGENTPTCRSTCSRGTASVCCVLDPSVTKKNELLIHSQNATRWCRR